MGLEIVEKVRKDTVAGSENLPHNIRQTFENKIAIDAMTQVYLYILEQTELELDDEKESETNWESGSNLLPCEQR